MIVYPQHWSMIGQPIEIRDIEETILRVLAKIDCPYLSFSGGLDSSLMLYFMTQIFDRVFAFTIGFPETHPDIKYSRLVAKEFGNVEHEVYIPTADEVGKRPEEDAGVRLFYKFLAGQEVCRVVACDGVDEYMGGYYDHQLHLDERTYYKFIRRLKDDHLKPLDKNSGRVQIYLPYLDKTVLYLLTQIPLDEKVDNKNRKKVMVQMAKGRIPDAVIDRWKYGFCDALSVKKARF